MEQPKVVPQQEVVARIQAELDAANYELENIFLPQLGHSEAKRLLVAIHKYPQEVADFSKEKEAMVRAFSLSKRAKDYLIAMGVEVVIEKMLRQQQEARGEVAPESEEEIFLTPESLMQIEEPQAAPKKRGKKKE